eukprot:2875489-Alexandrium_andersonii.AAC.1
MSRPGKNTSTCTGRAVGPSGPSLLQPVSEDALRPDTRSDGHLLPDFWPGPKRGRAGSRSWGDKCRQ